MKGTIYALQRFQNKKSIVWIRSILHHNQLTTNYIQSNFVILILYIDFEYHTGIEIFNLVLNVLISVPTRKRTTTVLVRHIQFLTQYWFELCRFIWRVSLKTTKTDKHGKYFFLIFVASVSLYISLQTKKPLLEHNTIFIINPQCLQFWIVGKNHQFWISHFLLLFLMNYR